MTRGGVHTSQKEIHLSLHLPFCFSFLVIGEERKACNRHGTGSGARQKYPRDWDESNGEHDEEDGERSSSASSSPVAVAIA
jgi:hypothetical protein